MYQMWQDGPLESNLPVQQTTWTTWYIAHHLNHTLCSPAHKNCSFQPQKVESSTLTMRLFTQPCTPTTLPQQTGNIISSSNGPSSSSTLQIGHQRRRHSCDQLYLQPAISIPSTGRITSGPDIWHSNRRRAWRLHSTRSPWNKSR